jgi:predicted nucleic acid-binding protein
VKPDIQPVTGSAALPRCLDPDDQKFVTLAFYSSARWLLTRDKALLGLNRRLKTKGIRVGTPMEWSASMH